ncbi:hypothetical protein FACS189411_08320 [Bacteroidia bacterium]|nr:hypothetical protein FACS189411_08320 [Bacteroidia bacterium]
MGTDVYRFLLLIFLYQLFCFSCTVDIDPSIANTNFGMQAIKYEYIIVIISLIGGIGCIIAGIVLTLLGFSGSIEWIVETTGFTSRLINASPGIVLMIIGFILVYKSRINIKSHRKNQNKNVNSK